MNTVLNSAFDIQATENALRSHESVREAVVVVRDEPKLSVVGYVTLSQPNGGCTTDKAAKSCDKDESRQVRLWQTVFDRCIYTNFNTKESVGRDFTGWVSAYDGKPLDIGEMNEWLDDTIDTIVDRHGDLPLDVLELGSGSGMVLFNLPTTIRSYHGFDPSSKAIEFVKANVKSFPHLDNKVQLFQGAATDLHKLLPSASPNIAIINSVAQYFPSQSYLAKVVQGLLELDSIRTIFFGDVRSLPLLEEFLVSKAFNKMGANTTKLDVREELAQAQSEFFVDPAFFTSLPSQFPDRIEHVEILPKKMHANNELVQYRFAAVIHLWAKGVAQSSTRNFHEIMKDQWIDFKDQNLDHESLLHLLRSSKSSPVAVSNIPYSKTSFERHVIDAVRNAEATDADWMTSVRQSSQSSPSAAALDLVSLARKAGYQVSISWARQYSQRGGFDAVFHHCSDPSDASHLWFCFPKDHEGRPSCGFTNQPLQTPADRAAKQKVKHVVQELQNTLEAKLPTHVSKDIVVLD